MVAPSHPHRLGRYEVVRMLAQGGMAELFLARLPGIEGFAKRVVIKRVHPMLARDREFTEMFLEEARLAATLHHQNIVQVHDIGHDDSGYFFTMEHLHGADVGAVMRAAGPHGVPLPIALEIARAAAAGLHYAHERSDPDGRPLGLVHRDVSPQNLFVTFDGGVKLLDFGIAKAVQQITNQHTRSGTLRGKIPYMSPEQCRSERIDRRSDVFSLAVVLWEITVGRRLFGADDPSDFEILKTIVETDAPPPTALIPTYPPSLERIVMRGLARDRDARYQTADALQADLEGLMRASGMWVTARDLAAFMRQAFGEQAAASMRIDAAEIGALDGGAPGSRATRSLPEPRPTADLPLAPGGAPGAGTQFATIPSVPHGTYPSQPDRPAPPPPGRGSTAALVLGAIGIAALALAAGYVLRGASAPAGPATTPAPPATGGLPATTATAPATRPLPIAPGAVDVHWFEPDDYLVTRAGLRDRRVDQRLNNLSVAKRITELDDGGKAEYVSATGKRIETKTSWTTRVARPEDLGVGTTAFCFGRSHDKECAAPATRREARDGAWLVGLIGDTSELATGFVTVGTCRCAIAGIRVIDER